MCGTVKQKFKLLYPLHPVYDEGSQFSGYLYGTKKMKDAKKFHNCPTSSDED
jgi:hypothetical protein